MAKLKTSFAFRSVVAQGATKHYQSHRDIKEIHAAQIKARLPLNNRPHKICPLSFEIITEWQLI